MQNLLAITPLKVKSGPAVPFLLDTVGVAAGAAFSTRKLASAYTGKALRVRRDSDNTEQDIGFNTAYNLDTVSLLSFVGSNNGYVTVWYDQTGNGNYCNQTTALSQPQLVASGVIKVANSIPAPLYGGGNLLTLSNTNSNFNLGDALVIASRTNASGTSPAIWSGYIGGMGTSASRTLGWLTVTSIGLNSVVGGYCLDNALLDSVVLTGSSTPAQNDTNLHQFNSFENSIIAPNVWHPTSGVAIGYGDPTYQYLVGNIGELVFYPTLLGSTLRGVAYTNQKAYWGTP